MVTNPVFKQKRLLFVDNRIEYFLSHRLPLAEAARAAGLEVHVATLTGGDAGGIRAAGFTYHTLTPRHREGSLMQEVSVLSNLARTYRSLRPDLLHHVTLRGVLYGGLTARWTGIPAVVDSVTGLGYLFSSDEAKVRLMRKVTTLLLHLAMRHRHHRVIFQNPDDLDLFQKAGLVSPERTVLLRGSGVDPATFTFGPEPEGTPVVVLAARMLWHKGIGEFVEAARLLRAQGTPARFVLVGQHDPDNPASVPEGDLRRWHEDGAVEWWGFRNDMPAVLAGAHVVCLPSYYREGVPKVLIEAAACGRPIVTSDMPGCREIVRDGQNGLLVPPRDSQRLAEALRTLLADGTQRRRMGQAGRALIEQEFSIDHVVGVTLGLYEELLRHAEHRVGAAVL